jgi:hypothetical protein
MDMDYRLAGGPLQQDFMPSRYRVVAAVAKWMAASNPLYREPAAAQGAVAGYRFRCVVRAAWCEPAVSAKERAEQKLVGPDQKLKQLRHVQKTDGVAATAVGENLLLAPSSAITLQFLFRAN